MPNVKSVPRTLLVVAALVLSVLVIAGAGPGSAAPRAAAESATTTLRTAVVLINFTDDAIGSSPEYRAAVAAKYFGSSGSLRTYYEEASDRRVSFRPLSGRPAVLGPWTINMRASCSSGTMASKTREQLSRHGIGSSSYDRLSIVFPNGKAGCNFGGLGQQPGKVTWMPSTFNSSGLVHELGHNFGYHHLSAVWCANSQLTNCGDRDYRGSSPMGGGGFKTGLAATELIKSGWYTSEQRLKNPAGGKYTLKPLHAPSSVAGRRMLDVPIDGSGGRVVVSYRKAGTTIDTGNETGVMLHKVTSTNYGRSKLVDATPGDKNVLLAGATITAPNGTKITVESVSDSSAVIRIGDRPTTTPPTTTTAPPTTTTTAPPGCPWWWPFC